MTSRAFLVVIGIVAASVFSGAAQAQLQIQIGGGSHYVRNQHLSYDQPRAVVVGNNSHYQPNPYRNYDHAIQAAVIRGGVHTPPIHTPSIRTRSIHTPARAPLHSYNAPRPQHGARPQYYPRQPNNHYRAGAYRSYDPRARVQVQSLNHYQPRAYGH